MPSTTTTHEPWCVEHMGRDEGLPETCCTCTVKFGSTATMLDGETYQRGTLFADQAEGEEQPGVIVEYAWRDEAEGSWNVGYGRMDETAVQAVHDALVDDPQDLRRALATILTGLKVQVSA